MASRWGGFRERGSFQGSLRRTWARQAQRILSFVFALSIVAGSGALTTGTATAQGRPQVVVPQKIFDFGTVTQGTVVKHSFVIKNAGDADLVIQRVVAACGCTAASASTAPIKPGEQSTIEVSFDTAGFSGEKYKTVRVNTNDIDNLSVVLSLKGVVEPDVIVEPQSIMLNDVVKGASGSGATASLRVSVRPGANIKIQGARAFSPHISIQEVSASPKEYRWNVMVDPSAPLGELRDRVVVGVSGATESTINVPVFAVVRGALLVEPTQISFGVVEGSVPLSRSVKLRNRGAAPVSIREVRSGHPAVSASVREIEKGKTYVVQVQVDPRQVTKDLRASLQIFTDHQDEPTITVGLFGVRPPKS